MDLYLYNQIFQNTENRYLSLSWHLTVWIFKGFKNCFYYHQKLLIEIGDNKDKFYGINLNLDIGKISSWSVLLLI